MKLKATNTRCPTERLRVSSGGKPGVFSTGVSVGVILVEGA